MRRPSGKAYSKIVTGFRLAAGSCPGACRIEFDEKLAPADLGGLSAEHVDPWLRTFPVTVDSVVERAFTVPCEVPVGRYGPNNTLWVHLPSSSRLSVQGQGSLVTGALLLSSANLGAWILRRSEIWPFSRLLGGPVGSGVAGRLNWILYAAAAGVLPQELMESSIGEYSDPTIYFPILETNR